MGKLGAPRRLRGGDQKEQEVMTTKADVNVAALEYAKSLRDMYTKVADAAITAQERNLAFARSVFERGVEELKTQTDAAGDVAQAVTQQAQKQRGAFETLTQQSADTYTDYLNGVLSFYEKGLEALRQTAK
jgi:hypothetical protein